MSESGSDWARLFRIAISLIRQVNSEHPVIDHWSLGGGTAMMLQIDHRESHDIDIFLADPQLLPYLDPERRDFEFEIRPSECTGDGSQFLKLAFKDIGEIDFVVGSALTRHPTTKRTVEGVQVDLETLAEILTKKIYYRGGSIKPRDIFDIAAAAKDHRMPIVTALQGYKTEVAKTLGAIDRLNPEFVNAAISAMAIRESYKPVARTAIADAKALLQSV